MSAPAFSVTDMVPPDVPEYAHGSWVAALVWAIGDDGVIDAFRAETGVRYTPPRDGLSRMIDTATGADIAFLKQFIEWFNGAVWGPWS